MQVLTTVLLSPINRVNEKNKDDSRPMTIPLCFIQKQLMLYIQGDPQKNETHEHVNKNFNFQAIATKHHTFHLNFMHGLHTKFH